jgi:hypothetical protein
LGLPWIRLDTTTFDHPKVLELLEAKNFRAIVVHLAAMAYTGKHGLDGFIPRSALRVLGGTVTDANRLVRAQLWDPAEGGWEVHGWREYQYSSEEHEKRRQRLSERGRKGAEAKWAKRKEGE